MPPTPVSSHLRPWLILALASLALATLAIACGGGGGDGQVVGLLTDAATVPTATPFPQPPEPIFPEDVATPISDSGGEAQPGVCGDTYIVESGDTFSTIAEKCGVDLDALLALNPDIDPRSLQVGQELKLPPRQE